MGLEVKQMGASALSLYQNTFVISIFLHRLPLRFVRSTFEKDINMFKCNIEWFWMERQHSFM